MADDSESMIFGLFDGIQRVRCNGDERAHPGRCFRSFHLTMRSTPAARLQRETRSSSVRDGQLFLARADQMNEAITTHENGPLLSENIVPGRRGRRGGNRGGSWRGRLLASGSAPLRCGPKYYSRVALLCSCDARAATRLPRSRNLEMKARSKGNHSDILVPRRP